MVDLKRDGDLLLEPLAPVRDRFRKDLQSHPTPTGEFRRGPNIGHPAASQSLNQEIGPDPGAGDAHRTSALPIPRNTKRIIDAETDASTHAFSECKSDRASTKSA